MEEQLSVGIQGKQNMGNDLIDGKAQEVKDIYETILDSLETFGKYRVEFKRTSIHIVNKAAFLGIHPRQKWVDVNIVSNHPLNSAMIKKTEQVSAHRYHNMVRIENKSQINKEMIALFKEAYELLS